MTMDSLPNKQEDLFQIEDAKPEDVEALRTIVRDAWLEIYPNEEYGITTEDISSIDWYSPEGLAKRRKEILEEKDVIHNWVLKNEKDKVVGFCKATKLSTTMGEIDAMYLLREIEGKGLGKKLIEKAFEWLGKDSDIKLKVVVYNTHAINFYKKFGFKETTNKIDYEGTKLPSGKEIPRIEMIKSHI